MTAIAFSKKWKSSKKPTKQRKYQMNAPMHIKGNFLNVHLSKELRQKYTTRSIRVRKGDKVKVLVGKYKGKEGKVDRVSVKRTKIFITGIEFTKKDGAKVLVPIHPSNCVITELDISDKKRKMILERKSKKQSTKESIKTEAKK